jgi:hypothetical protein
MVSMAVTSTEANSGDTIFQANSYMNYDRNDPHAHLITGALGGHPDLLRLDPVDDIKATRWNKIALNTALNSSATIMGVKIGEMRDSRIASDPRYADLLLALTDETVQVAQAVDNAPVSTEGALEKVATFVFGGSYDGHPMSMQKQFRAGEPIEIKLLSGGVSDLGKAHGVPTPMCDLITEHLNTYVDLRGETRAADFYQANPDDVERAIDQLLQKAAGPNLRRAEMRYESLISGPRDQQGLLLPQENTTVSPEARRQGQKRAFEASALDPTVKPQYTLPTAGVGLIKEDKDF